MRILIEVGEQQSQPVPGTRKRKRSSWNALLLMVALIFSCMIFFVIVHNVTVCHGPICPVPAQAGEEGR